MGKRSKGINSVFETNPKEVQSKDHKLIYKARDLQREREANNNNIHQDMIGLELLQDMQFQINKFFDRYVRFTPNY